MTTPSREQVEKWAREAGASELFGHELALMGDNAIEHFARLVRAATMRDIIARIDQSDDGEQPAYRHVQEEIGLMLIDALKETP